MPDGSARAAKGPFAFDVESAFTVDCTYVGMVSPAHLQDLLKRQPQVASCQIYAIAHRPRVSVDPRKFSCDRERMSLTFLADWGDGEPAEVVIEVPNLFAEPVTLRTRNNHTLVTFHDESGRLLLGSAASGWLSEMLKYVDPQRRVDFADVDANLLDLKVVYVGQSQDPNGAAESRLQNHSTLLKVLADISHATPHLEPWVILMAFGASSTLGMFGPWSSTRGWDESWEHHDSLLASPPPESQRVAVAEAALIRYFQPSYNRDFVDTFPSSRHSSYDHFFRSDYNAVGFELETLTTLNCRLWSDVVPPSFTHSRLFPLHDEKERRAFFDWQDGLDLSDILVRPADRPRRGGDPHLPSRTTRQ